MSEKAFAFVPSPSLFVFGVKCFTVTPFPPPPPSLPLQCQAGKNGNKYSRVGERERERETHLFSLFFFGGGAQPGERKEIDKKASVYLSLLPMGRKKSKNKGLTAWQERFFAFKKSFGMEVAISFPP